MPYPTSSKCLESRSMMETGIRSLISRPSEHIVLHGTPNAIACRAFPLTLKEVAKDWFTGLPPKSVDTFKELGRLFLAQFLATRKRKKGVTCLLTLCQGKEETLKDFML